MTQNLYLCSQKTLFIIWWINWAATFCMLLYIYSNIAIFFSNRSPAQGKGGTYIFISGLTENTIDSAVKKKCPLKLKYNTGNTIQHHLEQKQQQKPVYKNLHQDRNWKKKKKSDSSSNITMYLLFYSLKNKKIFIASHCKINTGNGHTTAKKLINAILFLERSW